MGIFQNIKRMLQPVDRRDTPSDRDLADLGVSRVDFDTLQRGGASTRMRMVQMAEIHGVSEEVLAEDHWRELEMAQTCALCVCKRRCDRFLNGEDVGFVLPECPNSSGFRALAR